jgi:hypothetical protein
MADVRSQPTIIESSNAPEVFASHMLQCNLDNGVVKLTFTSNRARLNEPEGGAAQHVCLTLTMPAVAFEGMARFLPEWIERVKLAAAPVAGPAH